MWSLEVSKVTDFLIIYFDWKENLAQHQQWIRKIRMGVKTINNKAYGEMKNGQKFMLDVWRLIMIFAGLRWLIINQIVKHKFQMHKH